MGKNRSIILIGHSIGGTSIGLSFTSLPEIFHSLILVDPVININNDKNKFKLGRLATIRTQTWRGLDDEEMIESFSKKTEFFGRWDPEVLRRFVEFGLYDDQE